MAIDRSHAVYPVFDPQGFVDLPTVRGRYELNRDLSRLTWMQVGGVADVLYKPSDINDLQHFKKEMRGRPCFTIGAGSNMLVRDGGYRGVVIRLASGFREIAFVNNTVEVGAGCLSRTLAITAANKGFSGLEFMAVIPGTVGGAVAMNAGAYNHEVKDVLLWVDMVDNQGNLCRYAAHELAMRYRYSSLPEEAVVVKACFRIQPAPIASVIDMIEDLTLQKKKTQPATGRTGGSTFKNPVLDESPFIHACARGLKAWQLIDYVGGRGMRVNDAEFSVQHCNFLLNTGHAYASDLETLAEKVRALVFQKTGVLLEWEIIIMGDKS